MMGFREFLEKNQVAASAIAIAIIVGFIVYFFWPSKQQAPHLTNQAYYTDDDGKTYFADDMAKVVPYTRNGKEVVRAYVYRCGNETRVHYVERYTPAGQQAAARSIEQSGGREVSLPESLMSTGIEYKRPSEAVWHPKSPGPQKCPDGTQPEWITP